MLVVANYAWPSRLLSYLRFIEARVSIVYFVDLDASGDPRMWSTAWSADQLYDLRLRPDAGVTALIFSSPRSAATAACLSTLARAEAGICPQVRAWTRSSAEVEASAA